MTEELNLELFSELILRKICLYIHTGPDLSEIVEEPVAKAHFLGREVSGSLRRVYIDLLHHFIGDRRRSKSSRTATAAATVDLRLCC